MSRRSWVPEWWKQRLQSPLSELNNRLAVSKEQIAEEHQERLETEMRALDFNVGSNAPESARQQHLAIQSQIEKQRSTIEAQFEDLFTIEDINNILSYELAGSMLPQIQGTITGQVRINIVSRVRAHQSARAQIEERMLQRWETLGEGFRD